jgi:tetratricopeptide (TPR) repeat protein
MLLLLVVAVVIHSCTGSNSSAIDSKSPFYKDSVVRSLTVKIQEHNKDAALYYDRGLRLHRIGDDSLALNDFKQAVSLDSSKAQYFSAIGDLLFEHKDIEGSVKWLQRAVSLDPKDPKAHLKIAKMMLYMKDYPKAFTEVNTVLRQDVYNPEGYFLKGMIYKDLKDTDKAISSFQTAINTAPDYSAAVLQLGILFSARHNPIALKYFDNVYKMDTTDVLPIYAKGMFYQEQNDYAHAKDYYRECIEHDHQYLNAFFNLGWIYMQQDSLEKAWRHFDIATKIEPNNFKAYYNRGLCSEMMKKKTEAIEDYKQALVFNPKYADAQVALKRLESK